MPGRAGNGMPSSSDCVWVASKIGMSNLSLVGGPLTKDCLGNGRIQPFSGFYRLRSSGPSSLPIVIHAEAGDAKRGFMFPFREESTKVHVLKSFFSRVGEWKDSCGVGNETANEGELPI